MPPENVSPGATPALDQNNSSSAGEENNSPENLEITAGEKNNSAGDPPGPPEKKETRGRHPGNCFCQKCRDRRENKKNSPANSEKSAGEKKNSAGQSPEPPATAKIIEADKNKSLETKLRELAFQNATFFEENFKLKKEKADLENKINLTRKVPSAKNPGKSWLDDLCDFWGFNKAA